MVNLHIGPIVRGMSRHKAIFALVVLELASGFTIISCLMVTSSWYFSVGHKATGHDEQNLVAVRVVTPNPAAAPVPQAEGVGDAPHAAPDADRDDRAAIASLPDFQALTAVSGSAIDERWTFPTAFARAPAAGDPGPEAFGMLLAVDRTAGAVLGFRFVAGHLPDGPAAQQAQQVVITRKLGQRLFGGAPAVGQTISGDRLAPVRVAGVIEDVMMATSLLPHAESVAFHFGAPPDERDRRYLVRARPGRRAALLAALPAALGPVRADRLVSVAPFDVRRSRGQEISNGLVLFLSIIAAVVALMAMIGTMSVTSFLVTERRQQIGIRRALGASRADVLRLFLVESSIATAVGTGIGLVVMSAMFLPMRRVYLDLHFGWGQLVLSAVLLWLNATASAMIPAARAARVSPSVASRGL
jgi:putative ABC transport system permease protein